MSAEAIRLAVGLIAIFFVLSRLATRWIEHHLPKPGIASGVFWGPSRASPRRWPMPASPPYQIHVLPQRLPKLTFVGTTSLYFAATNVLRIPSYFALGQLTWANLSVGLALVPLAIATNFLGVWLVQRMPVGRSTASPMR